VQNSTLCYTWPLIELLHLQIVEKDDVRFRTHKRSNCADEHGDGEHIDSILREE